MNDLTGGCVAVTLPMLETAAWPIPPVRARRPARWASAALAGLAALAAGAPARAADKPLWEAGIGVAVLSLPAYRGSDQSRTRVLPAPYIVYRGDFLKADREGLRASLFDTDRIDLTVSVALSPPADSQDVRAREGMPDLRATFEIGPKLNLLLWQSANKARRLELQLPVRAVYTLQSRPDSQGWVAHPKLNLDLTDLPSFPGWNLGLQVGALYGSREQHQALYGVDAAYATAGRPAYRATGGYAGVQFLAGVSKRYRSHWVGAFVRVDSLSGASFADSPLVKSRQYVAGGVAVSWILGESSRRVPSDD